MAVSRSVPELAKLIKDYQDAYYNGEALVSDAEFDALWDELKLRDPSNILLQNVGADSGNFAKLEHIMPMGSQEKAANAEEFLSWASTHNYPQYLVEYKLDGASLELQYRNGLLIHAVTRGDGTIGDDITSNAKNMSGLKSVLTDSDGNRVPFTGGIRGEVIMTHFVHKKFFSDKANCRNAANGLMKRKDGQDSDKLKVIVYDALSTDSNSFFSNEEGKITWLSSLGFDTSVLKICNSPQEVIDYRSLVMEQRSSLDYDIDGLVVKENIINIEDASRTRPDRQIAFKFSLEEAVSILRDVEWNENGATYTPVALFDTVELNGTKVQRASLANPNNINNLGLKIGSHIVVVKRGEIIPKIERVVAHDGLETRDIVLPAVCSTCGATLVNEGTRLYCPNSSCSKRILHQITKWVNVADIRDLGESLINALFNDGVLTSISDIYKLNEEILVPYFLNKKSIENEKQSLGAQKVIHSIQTHRSLSLSKFIAGFDIDGIGETVVEKLVNSGFGTLEKLLNVSAQEVASVYGFADIMAKTFVDGIAYNKEEMLSLTSSGTIIVKEVDETLALVGKSFCFTGTLNSIKRADAQNLVKELGGTVKSSVVKGLSYLVTNDTTSGSSKNKKAAELGTEIIDEEQFLTLVGKR